jgi:transposase
MVGSEVDMPPNFRAEDREQAILFPPTLNEYIPEGHLARFVREVIEQFDVEGRLQPFYEDYHPEGRGGKAFHPRAMLGVIVYGVTQGTVSSRKIARACQENLAFRFLASNQFPDFRSIAKFRKRHLEAFGGLFREVLKLCQAAGLVELGRVAIDGRRVKGNASRDTTLTAEALDKQIAELITELLVNAERADASEDAEFGDDSGDDLPPDFRSKEDRLERLTKARQVIADREQRMLDEHKKKLALRKHFEESTGNKKNTRPPKAPNTKESKNTKAPPKANTTDPDSRMLKVRQGFVQGYNAQVAVDSSSQVIVSQHVTQDANDAYQLGPALDGIEANVGQLPDELVADSGYCSADNIDLAELRGVEAFMATKKDSKQRKVSKVGVAPRGRPPSDLSPRELMERKLLTKRGREAYRTRGPVVEGTFGQQVVRGLTAFWLRGLDAVRVEWSLWCTTHNLLKLWRAGAVIA